MANLLDVIPEYVLTWLVQKGKERRLADKEILIQEGALNSSLWIVLDGLFGVYADERRLEHIPPGSVVGEIPVFTDAPAPSTIRAEEPSLVLELPPSILFEKLDHDHIYASDFYRSLLVVVSQRLHQTGLRLKAAETTDTLFGAGDPSVKKAQEEIDRFKKTMLSLDKEVLKHGAVTEERCQEFFLQAANLMQVSHETLSENSPLSEHVKVQLGARLQHEMLPYLLTTETAERFYSKPRGYAGDYLSIHNIYRNHAGGTGRLGPIVDRMFLETPPSKAVKNRRSLLANEILQTVRASTNGPVKVMCMASGPATEIFDAFALMEDKTRMKATLLDIDLQALAFVDELRGRQKLAAQMTLVNENLIALYLGRGKTRVDPQNLIYSIGLIDYLNDKLVGKLLQYVYENLAPGGRVILGNFHPRNPAKEFMDYVLEWNLIHRTEDDMNRLFLESPFKRQSTRIQFEGEGVNLFAECVRN